MFISGNKSLGAKKNAKKKNAYAQNILCFVPQKAFKIR